MGNSGRDSSSQSSSSSSPLSSPPPASAETSSGSETAQPLSVSTSAAPIILTPSSTPTNTPKRSTSSTRPPQSTTPENTLSIVNLGAAQASYISARQSDNSTNMDDTSADKTADKVDPQTQPTPSSQNPASGNTADTKVAATVPDNTNATTKLESKAERKHHSRSCKGKHAKKHKKSKGKRSTKKSKHATLDDDDDSSSDDSSDSDDSDDSPDSGSTDSDSSDVQDDEDSSSEEARKSKKKRSSRKSTSSKNKKKKNKKRSKKSKRSDDTDDSDDSNDDSDDSESDESDNRARRRSKRGKKKGKKSRRSEENEGGEEYLDDEPPPPPPPTDAAAQLEAIKQLLNANILDSRLPTSRNTIVRRFARRGNAILGDLPPLPDLEDKKRRKKKSDSRKKGSKRGSTLEYKRVDQLWDNTIHNYKLTESAEDQEDEFAEFIFTVRRRFDWENKYKNTVVDIKSKLLKEALQEVMKDVKGVSLVEDQPSIDPNMLFLYLEELRKYAKKTLKARVQLEKKRKSKKRVKLMISHCKVLLSYIDEDYEETKKTLYPMLEAGNITFDLIWALFKPNTLAYTSTYGSHDDPRCFKVDYACKESSFMRGEWYSIEGRYLEYDGKSYGLGDFEVAVDSFQGPRKITSLSTYPIEYHKDPEGLKKQLIERGKRFVSMEGMNYRFHKGLAFMKKKKTVAKVNINGRVMIDPAIFRRINPNYPISMIKPKDPDDDAWPGGDDDDSSECGCGSGSESEEDNIGGEGPQAPFEEHGSRDRTRFRIVRDKEDKVHVVEVPIDEDGREIHVENIDKLPEGTTPEKKREFTEEELLIASPVVLGFAFSEKLWLEFSLSGINEIEWNEGAFDSLVLPDNQKSIVKALVESHKFHAAKTIDDVIQGKGKGLVTVLHGPPGTGKTLTAEGIAELLKCPLYMVSAGELGTDPRMLEHELQKILDIAHSWGAVLLLDEADVFLEKRQVHDIHRNALVSIFLRLLEYFQGILFLTTNRVETFDDAFQSRIHVALRYGGLTFKAKRMVWKMLIDKVRLMEGVDTIVFKDSDLDTLARNNLNGRQIKNSVRTAQALAVNEKQALSMDHIKRVLEVAESFEQDLKGGTGYRDAMRQYT